MEMTTPQREYLAEVRSAFGTENVTHKPPRESDGIVRISAEGRACHWEWSINREGDPVFRQGTMKLFDAPITNKVRKGTWDEEYSVTQKPRGDDARPS